MKLSTFLFSAVSVLSAFYLIGCKPAHFPGNNTQAEVIANADTEEGQQDHCMKEEKNGNFYLNWQCQTLLVVADATAVEWDEWVKNGRKGPEPQGHICVVPSTKFTDRYAVSVNCVLQISGEQQKEEFQAWSVPAGETLEGIRKRYRVSVNQ